MADRSILEKARSAMKNELFDVVKSISDDLKLKFQVRKFVSNADILRLIEDKVICRNVSAESYLPEMAEKEHYLAMW